MKKEWRWQEFNPFCLLEITKCKCYTEITGAIREQTIRQKEVRPKERMTEKTNTGTGEAT